MRVLIILVAIGLARATDVRGKKSSGKDDARSDAKCPVGEIGVGCSCTPLGSCDGAYFGKDGTCHAFHRSTRGNRGYAQAVVKCLPMVVYKTSANWAAGPTEKCPAGFKLTDCQVYSPWAQNFPSKLKPIVAGNVCSADKGCTKCKVQAICWRSTAGDDANKVVTGPKSTGRDDAQSVAKCPAGGVAVGCACTPLGSCDGAYVNKDGNCAAFHRASRGNTGFVQAVAKCKPLPRVAYATSANYATGPKQRCSNGYKLTDCQVYSPWAQNFPSKLKPKVSGNNCIADRGCKKCKVQAVCIKMPVNVTKTC